MMMMVMMMVMMMMMINDPEVLLRVFGQHSSTGGDTPDGQAPELSSFCELGRWTTEFGWTCEYIYIHIYIYIYIGVGIKKKIKMHQKTNKNASNKK